MHKEVGLAWVGKTWLGDSACTILYIGKLPRCDLEDGV